MIGSGGARACPIEAAMLGGSGVELPRPTKKSVLLLDLNGTLIDDELIIQHAREATYRHYGVEHPPTSAQIYEEMEGNDYLTPYRNRGVTASRDELNAIFGPIYESRIHEVGLFPGVKDVLVELREREIRLALITTQLESLALPLLQRLGVYSLFNAYAFHVLDKTKQIGKAMKLFVKPPGACAYIGDTPSDMRSAVNAKITPVAFLNGYIPYESFQTIPGCHYIKDFRDVLKLV